MTKKNLGRNAILAAGLFTAVLAGAIPALAGFEFKTPAPVPVSPLPAPPSFPPAYAAPPVAPQKSPIMWSETSHMPAQRVPGIEAIPLAPSERRSLPPAAAPDIVSGFGSDLPLLVALQQVVPQQYKVSLSPGVDGGAHVSWQGDRPWKQVLSDMLSPLQLSFGFEGNRVVIKRSPASRFPVARVSSSRKTDMIPEDMVSTPHKSVMPPPRQLAQAPTGAAQPTAHGIQWEPETVPVQPLPVPVAAPAMPPTDTVAQPKATPAQPQHKKNSLPPMPEPIAVSAPVAVPPSTGATAMLAPTVAATAWRAGKGQTLKEVLKDWSAVAHVKLYWTTDYDYKLNGNIDYTGSFEEAVGKLFDQFSDVKPQPYGQLHRNNETGAVLVVNTYGTYN